MALRLRTKAALLLAAFGAGLAAAPAAASEQSRRSAAVSVDYLIGRWTDNPMRCTAAIDFKRDGSFTVGDGRGGRWRLSGTSLTFSGEGGVNTVRLERLGPHELRVYNSDGTTGGSYRCASDAEEWHAPLTRR